MRRKTTVYCPFIRKDKVLQVIVDDEDYTPGSILDAVYDRCTTEFNKATPPIGRYSLDLARLYQPLPIVPGSRLVELVRAAYENGQISMWEDAYVETLEPSTHPLHQFEFVVRVDDPAEPLIPPLKAAEKDHRQTIENTINAPSPSDVARDPSKYDKEQRNRPTYNGRPYNLRGPPVVLYNEALAFLKDNLQHDKIAAMEVFPEDVSHTAQLFLESSFIYTNESHRQAKIVPHLRKLLRINLDEFVPVKNGGKVAEADAMARVMISNGEQEHAPATVICEFKTELGSQGDAGLQAVLTLKKLTSSPAYSTIRNSSCCPCIIISVAGPHICVAGAILADVFVVQQFTDYIYLGGDPYSNDKVIYVSKVFNVVADAIDILEKYYEGLTLRETMSPDYSRLFPRPTYLPDCTLPVDFNLEFAERFIYQGIQAGEYSRSLFRASLNGSPVLVKFCERYSPKAHKLLAEAGFAPKLHFCQMLCGGVIMVIMDVVEGQTLYYQYAKRMIPKGIIASVQKAIDILHRDNIVFGDLRRPNVMVSKKPPHEDTVRADYGEEFKVTLVDFDWAGVDGEARYPALLNDSGEINWADGVGPTRLMRKNHDIDMLANLNSRATINEAVAQVQRSRLMSIAE